MDEPSIASVTSLTQEIRENNLRQYGQHLQTRLKVKQCKRLKDETHAKQKMLEMMRAKLKEKLKFDKVKKKAALALQDVSKQVQMQKSFIHSANIMQKIAADKRKRKHAKMVIFIDGQKKCLLEYYNNRPAVCKINDLEVLRETLKRMVELKAAYLAKADGFIDEAKKTHVDTVVAFAESSVNLKKSVEAAEKQKKLKERIAELQLSISELKIKQEPPKNPIRATVDYFCSDAEWGDDEDIQSVQPCSVASPDTQVASSYEQGPLSCLSLEVSYAGQMDMSYAYQPPAYEVMAPAQNVSGFQKQPQQTSDVQQQPQQASGYQLQVQPSSDFQQQPQQASDFQQQTQQTVVSQEQLQQAQQLAGSQEQAQQACGFHQQGQQLVGSQEQPPQGSGFLPQSLKASGFQQQPQQAISFPQQPLKMSGFQQQVGQPRQVGGFQSHNNAIQQPQRAIGFQLQASGFQQLSQNASGSQLLSQSSTPPCQNTSTNSSQPVLLPGTLDPESIDTDAIMNEPPSGNYYYNANDYGPLTFSKDSPDPPQSVGSDLDNRRYAKSPDGTHCGSSEPPSPAANPSASATIADSFGMPNFFARQEGNAEKGSVGSFFNFGSSATNKKESTSSFFNFF